MATRTRRAAPEKVDTMVDRAKRSERAARKRRLLQEEEEKGKEARMPSIRKMANEIFSNASPASKKSKDEKPKAPSGFKKGGTVAMKHRATKR